MLCRSTGSISCPQQRIGRPCSRAVRSCPGGSQSRLVCWVLPGEEPPSRLPGLKISCGGRHTGGCSTVLDLRHQGPLTPASSAVQCLHDPDVCAEHARVAIAASNSAQQRHQCGRHGGHSLQGIVLLRPCEHVCCTYMPLLQTGCVWWSQLLIPLYMQHVCRRMPALAAASR